MGALDTVATGDAGGIEKLEALVAGSTEGRGCDAVIECTGEPSVWELAPRLARRGASVVLFGGCAGGTRVSFETSRLHYDGVELSSPFHFRPRDVAEARRLLLQTGIDWSPLVSGHAALDDVPSLFATLQDSGQMKIAIVPDTK